MHLLLKAVQQTRVCVVRYVLSKCLWDRHQNVGEQMLDNPKFVRLNLPSGRLSPPLSSSEPMKSQLLGVSDGCESHLIHGTLPLAANRIQMTKLQDT